MELYLVRHGTALSLEEQGVSDDKERILSSGGKKRTRKVAKMLVKINCFPEKICTSPYIRASQTATIMADLLTPKFEIEFSDFLKPGAKIGPALSYIRKINAGKLMLVGHMPYLTTLASAILTGNESLLIMDFDKSGVCMISWEGVLKKGKARLNWLIDSKIGQIRK